MKSAYLRIILILLMVLSPAVFIFDWNVSEVKAMEFTTFSVNCSTGVKAAAISAYGEGDTWAECRGAAAGTDLASHPPRASVKYQSDWKKWWIRESFVHYDISGLPENVEIVEIRIVGNPDIIDDTGDWGANHYYSFYACDTATVDNPIPSDYGHIYQDGFEKNRIAGPVGQNSLSVGVDYAWKVSENDYQFFTDNPAGNSIYLNFTTEYQALNWEPGEAINNALIGVYLAVGARLEVDYVAATEERSLTDSGDGGYHTNALVDTTILGTEVADNITWNTIRCLYSDEYPEIFVNGDSGANISLQLYDETGNILSSITDSIRTDDKYAWQINEIPSDFEGFIRVRELNFGITSLWGYVAASPDGSEKTNRIYAEYTEHPQYDRAFSAYVVAKGDKLFYHWKTTIDGSTELPYYNVEVWDRGDNVTGVYYDATLDDMADDYYKGSATFNQDNLHWRYMILTPGYLTGQTSYNGLVHNINLPFDRSHKGFIQAVITDNVSNEVTESHSAYWYLTNANEGISIISRYSNYAVDDEIIIDVNIGSECNVEYDLPSLKVEMILEDDVVQVHYHTIVEGKSSYKMNGFSTEGSYLARCYFYSQSKTYEYVKDIEFGVSGDTTGGLAVEGGVPGFGDWMQVFKDLINRWGLDNEGGHWLLIIALALIVAIAFKSMPMVATGLIVLIIAGAMIFKWLNPWVIVLLSLGAGVFIYSWVKRGRKTGV